jgi:hypothetical protein
MPLDAITQRDKFRKMRVKLNIYWNVLAALASEEKGASCGRLLFLSNVLLGVCFNARNLLRT